MIFFVLLLSFLLRLPMLGGSFWMDEAAQALESTRPLSQQLEIAQDFQPPLLHLLTHFGLYFGQSEWWLRLIGALIPALVTIFFAYKIAEKLFGHSVALLSSLLLATSSLHIFYSQELRPYSLPAMFAMLATWQVLHLIEKKSRAKWPFIIFSILGLYSSYLYPFMLAAHLSFLWSKKHTWRQLFGLIWPITIAFGLWLPKFLQQLQVGQTLRIDMPGWDEVVSLTPLRTTLLLPVKFLFGVLDVEISTFYVASSLLLAGISGYLLYRLSRQSATRQALLTFFLLLIWPILLAWLVSLFVPVLQAKRVLMLLPFFYMLLSYLIVQGAKLHKKLAILMASVLLSIQIYGITSYWSKPALQRENWRSLMDELDARFPQATMAVFSFDDAFAPWRWYQGEQIPYIATGSFYANNLPDPQQTLSKTADFQQVLLFDYLRDLTDPDDVLPATLGTLGFVEIGAIDYHNIGFVRIYQRTN